MPTKPNVKTFSGDSVAVLNAIRNSASTTYQERIPEATRNNIAEIGNAMMQFQSTQNEFLSALVNRIASVIITSKSYSNPLKMFKRGTVGFGETIEEVFVNIAKAHQFDPAVAENEVFKREIPDVDAVFHKMNLQNFYKATISNEQLRQAFLSYSGITDLIARIVDSLYSGSEVDEFIMMKQLISDDATRGRLHSVTVPEVSKANAEDIVIAIKEISDTIEFPKSTYNSMGVVTFTPKNKQVLLVNPRFNAVNDVAVLASAFNMSKADFLGRRVLVDDFGSLSNVCAALVDEDYFMVFDNMTSFTENYNGEGLYWNYWYHIWKTFSTSPFANAILFTTDSVTVTNVTVTPGNVTASAGQSVQFNAAVTGTGYPNKEVVWSVDSDTSTIDANGRLNISASESKPTLTVTATSVATPTVSGKASVTIE